MRNDLDERHTLVCLSSMSLERAVLDVAARQHAVVSLAQLRELGMSRRGVQHRVARGFLHPKYRGVYAVGHPRLTQHGRWLAAVLACGPGAVLSHRSAAALWGLLAPVAAVEVSTDVARRERPGITLRSAFVHQDERTVHHAIPTTTVPRTLLDLAAVLAPHRLERAANEADVLRLTDPLSLAALVARHPNKRGVRSARAQAAGGANHTRSELEAAFLAFLDAHGLPRPATNVAIAGHEVDCVWRTRHLIAELDGRAYHDTALRFESDRARDRALAVAGWRTVRITWRQVHRERAALASDLRRLLA
jgi:very-short-patch-repair endonuclease